MTVVVVVVDFNKDDCCWCKTTARHHPQSKWILRLRFELLFGWRSSLNPFFGDTAAPKWWLSEDRFLLRLCCVGFHWGGSFGKLLPVASFGFVGVCSCRSCCSMIYSTNSSSIHTYSLLLPVLLLNEDGIGGWESNSVTISTLCCFRVMMGNDTRINLFFALALEWNHVPYAPTTTVGNQQTTVQLQIPQTQAACEGGDARKYWMFLR